MAQSRRIASAVVLVAMFYRSSLPPVA